MSDPLGRYLKYNKDQLGYMDKNGIDPDDPLADALLPKNLLKPKDYRFESAMGRRDIEAETNARQLEQYKRSFETATGDRKVRLGNQIKELESQSGAFSIAPTLGESVKRFVGGAAGAIPQMFPAIGDVALYGAEKIESGVNKLGINTGSQATKIRERLQETIAGIDEITGAKGVEGLVGSFAGALGTGAVSAGARAVSTSARVGAWSISPNMVPRVAAGAIKTIEKGVNIANLPGQAFGEMSQGTLRFLGKAAILQPAARAALEGGRAARVAGSMIGDLPINVLQALSLPDANPYDIARTIALGTAGSAAGGLFSSRTLFDQPKSTPFDADLSTPATGKADPAMEALAARADRIAEWQAANPDKSWAKLEPSEQTAIFGDVPVEAGQGWVRLEDQATALRSYIEGTMEDVDAAKAAFRALTQAGVKPDALVPMLGMTVQVQDGHVLLFDADGNVPNPERLLLASGEAPRALEAAARAQSDSKLKQPTMETTPEGNQMFMWELPNGNVFHVVGTKVDDIFRIMWASADNGPKSMGPRAIIQAKKQLLDMTGATDISGFRISGARPGRDTGDDPVRMPRPAPELGRDGTNATDPTGDTPPQPGRGETDGTPFDMDQAKAEWNAIQDRADDGLASAEEIRHGMELYNDIEAAGGWRAEDYVADAPRSDEAQAPRPYMEPEIGAEPATAPRPRPALTEPKAPLRPPTTDALETVTPRKPLDEMTLGELESLMDKVYSRFDANPALMKTDAYRVAQRDAAKIGAVVKAKEARGPESQYVLEQPVDDNALYSLITSDITKLSERQLGELNIMLSAKIPKLDTSPEKDLLVDKLRELRNYQRTREVNTTPQKMASAKSEDIYDVLLRADMEKKPGRNDRGVAMPQTVAAIASSSLGGLWGYVQGDEDTTNAERMRNATIGAMVTGGAVVGAFAMKGRMHRQNIQKRAKLPGEAGLSAAMVSKHDETPGTVNAKIAASLTWHARLYQRIYRPSTFGERVSRILAGGAELGKQVGDMLASFGLWHHNTTEWMFNGPRQQNPDGTWTPVTTIRADGTIAEIKPMSQIIREADGNMDMLGKTAMALTAIEHFTRTGKTPHPKLTPGDLSQFIANVDQKFIAGAMAMRDMHLGMLDLQVRAGLITHEARAAMASERYYTALERVFGSAVDASAGEVFGEVGAKIREKIGSPLPVKSREGPNDWDIRNPVETLMHNIPRVMKAVELQDKKAAFISLYESSNIPDALKNTIMNRVTITQKERGYIEANQDKIDMLREYLPKISEEDAHNMVATYDATPLGPKSPYMTYIRNGKKEVWRLADDLTDTFQYMQGHEISAFAKLIGLTGDPLRLGIGFSPDFIARMAWFDVFQTYMNSKYGSSLRDMAPGVNWADAFYQIWVKSPEARNFGGGTAEGTVFEGMRSPEEIVRRAQAQGDTYGADIWRNVKQGDLPSAYKTLLIPFATAGRGSEFFADRRHGKSVQEAHRSANAVTGYYNQVGMYTAGLYRMIPFLKGTAQSLDQAFAASGMHPYREYDAKSPWRVPGTDIKWGDKRKSMMWMAKGTVLASGIAAIYAANYGDEEIDQLRQTKQGRRFLFFRTPGGGIMSVRKPAGPEGVLFGSGVEIALDAWNSKEPEAVKEWVGAFRRELTLPWLPPIMATAATLITGTDVSFGSPLVGTHAAKLPTELQSRTNTTDVAKTASSAIVNTFGDPGNGTLGRAISPAGIDYIVRTLGGTLANEAFKLADFSRAWKETGSVPAAQEWPIIRKFVTVDMTRQQTRDMQDFYEQVGDAERISNGMAASLEAGDVEGYNAIVKRAGPKVYTATLLLETRRDLVEFTRAIEEMKNMPGADPKYKREMILVFRKQIQLLMGQALDATRAIQD